MKRTSLIILFLASLCIFLSACGGETAQSCPMNPRGGLSWPIEPVQKLTILERFLFKGAQQATVFSAPPLPSRVAFTAQ